VTERRIHIIWIKRFETFQPNRASSNWSCELWTWHWSYWI